jgi:hypothetical protein
MKRVGDKAAGALRFASAAHFAMYAGAAPLPVSSPQAATGLRCLRGHLAHSVWQALRSAEMRRQALRTDACPAAQSSLARASSGVDIGATSDCGIVFGGGLRWFRSQGP